MRVTHNIIRGGIWNGITLGSLQLVGSPNDVDDVPDRPSSEDPCDPCRPADTTEEDDPNNPNGSNDSVLPPRRSTRARR